MVVQSSFSLRCIILYCVCCVLLGNIISATTITPRATTTGTQTNTSATIPATTPTITSTTITTSRTTILPTTTSTIVPTTTNTTATPTTTRTTMPTTTRTTMPTTTSAIVPTTTHTTTMPTTTRTTMPTTTRTTMPTTTRSSMPTTTLSATSTSTQITALTINRTTTKRTPIKGFRMGWFEVTLYINQLNSSNISCRSPQDLQKGADNFSIIRFQFEVCKVLEKYVPQLSLCRDFHIVCGRVIVRTNVSFIDSIGNRAPLTAMELATKLMPIYASQNSSFVLSRSPTVKAVNPCEDSFMNDCGFHANCVGYSGYFNCSCGQAYSLDLRPEMPGTYCAMSCTELQCETCVQQPGNAPYCASTPAPTRHTTTQTARRPTTSHTAMTPTATQTAARPAATQATKMPKTTQKAVRPAATRASKMPSTIRFPTSKPRIRNNGNGNITRALRNASIYLLVAVGLLFVVYAAIFLSLLVGRKKTKVDPNIDFIFNKPHE